MALPLLIPIVLRLAGGLLVRLGPMLVSTVLQALAISTITFVGVKVGVDAIHNMVKSNVTGMPAAALQMLGLLKFDIAIEILFAAVAGRLALGLLNGVAKKMVMK